MSSKVSDNAPFDVECTHRKGFEDKEPVLWPAFDRGIVGNSADPQKHPGHHVFRCPVCETTERVSPLDLLRLGHARLVLGLGTVPLLGIQYLLEQIRRADREAAASGNEPLE